MLEKMLMRVVGLSGRLLYADTVIMERMKDGTLVNTTETNFGPFDEHGTMSVVPFPERA